MMWLDRFFESYYARRPVNATFIGVHAHDHALPDWSENGAGDALAEVEALLGPAAAGRTGAAAAGAADEDASFAARDERLARGYLRTQAWELRSSHFHRGNPSAYTGEAVFGVMSLFLGVEDAAVAGRVPAAIARMDAIPAFLAHARQNVRRPPRAWSERAEDECKGARALFTEGLPLLAAERGITDPAFTVAAERAASAFAQTQAHLAVERAAPAREDVAAGEEALLLYLRDGHFLDESPDEIARHAEAELRDAQARLAAGAKEFGAGTPDDALAALADAHPSARGYYVRYQEIWDRARAAAEAHGLVTWKEHPIRYVPRPAWVRAAAPYLYFLPYRSPAAFGRPKVHEYLVTPIEPSMPEAEQRALLRANGDAAITSNHVIHHGGIGHHVQNAYAFASRSRVGRIAAIDCASRIAMFSGGTMAEGWACYATDLMREIGFLTPLQAYAETHTRARMCARAVVDVRLHQGRFTLDDAQAFYEREAGMPPAFARAEATKNSMFPGAALMYVAGTDGLHRLRRQVAEREGARFSLRAFHDKLLSYGSVPVALAAEALLAEASS